jgi:hypothetical protein
MIEVVARIVHKASLRHPESGRSGAQTAPSFHHAFVTKNQKIRNPAKRMIPQYASIFPILAIRKKSCAETCPPLTSRSLALTDGGFRAIH